MLPFGMSTDSSLPHENDSGWVVLESNLSAPVPVDLFRLLQTSLSVAVMVVTFKERVYLQSKASILPVERFS